jgi:hypothetical protein
MSRKYTANTAFELTFMKIKLEIDLPAKSIKFDNEVMDIYQDLINVVFYIVKNINSIPRADLDIRQEELQDTTLWDIEAED